MKFHKDITKIKRVTFFWDSVYTACSTTCCPNSICLDLLWICCTTRSTACCTTNRSKWCTTLRSGFYCFRRASIAGRTDICPAASDSRRRRRERDELRAKTPSKIQQLLHAKLTDELIQRRRRSRKCVWGQVVAMFLPTAANLRQRRLRVLKFSILPLNFSENACFSANCVVLQVNFPKKKTFFRQAKI